MNLILKKVKIKKMKSLIKTHINIYMLKRNN